MDSEELLAQLADIRLPEAVSWWPPAPGWWLLLTLIAVAVFFGAQRFRLARAKKLRLQGALNELKRSAAESRDPLTQLNAVNSVLRRVALVHYSAAEVAGLSGQSWAEFLRGTSNEIAMSDALFEAFARGRFQRAVSLDDRELADYAHKWVALQYRMPSSQEAN